MINSALVGRGTSNRDLAPTMSEKTLVRGAL